MASLHRGTVEKHGISNTNASETSTAKLEHGPPSKKRKAQDVITVEDDKENVERPSTPPPTQSKIPSEPAQHERTPGRVGPIKKESFKCEPDIKPFKGPPGKKVRKTAWEKDQEYKQFVREHEEHCFHELHVCYAKGPNGSPTYDKAGFQLDYDKVADWMKPKPYNKRAMVRNMDRSIERLQQEGKRMAEIFFEKGEAPSSWEWSNGVNYWKDRVSKDLGVPWHKIEVKHFEEWEKKGFKKARKGDYETISQEENDRMTRMMTGASLRK